MRLLSPSSKLYSCKFLQRHSPGFEIFLILLLSFISFFIALTYLKTHPSRQGFYQYEFGPSISIACGQGFHGVNNTLSKPLADFLALKKPTFSCADLPLTANVIRLDLFQNTEAYMMWSVGMLWHWLGVDWKNAYPLEALLYALSIIGLYGVFRLGMGVGLSVLATSLFLFFSGTQYLTMVPELRDYSVAPFILLSLCVLGNLIKRPFTRLKTCVLAVFAGVIMGIGLGFREDLLIYIPLFITALFLFLPTKIFQEIPTKIFASLLFVIVIFALGYPTLHTLHGGNNMYHVALMGLERGENLYLGVLASPVYQMMLRHEDGYVWSVVSVYSQFIHHLAPVVYASKEYAAMGAQYYFNFIQYFPGDFVTRVLASMWSVLLIPYDPLMNIFTLHPWVVMAIRLLALFLPCLVIILISKKSLRLGLFLVCLLIFLGGYPAIQFEARHVFYLSFISIWAVFFVIQRLIISRKRSATKLILTNQHTPTISWSKAIMVVMLPLLGMIIFRYIAIAYQEKQLITYVHQLASSQVQTIIPKKIYEKGLNTFIELPEITPPEQKNWLVQFNYLVLSMDTKNCHSSKYYFKFLYQLKPESMDLNEKTNTPKFHQDVFDLSVNQQGKFYYPMYNSVNEKFIGIEMPTQNRMCLKQIAQVINPQPFKFLLAFSLPENWKQLTLHQTFAMGKSDIVVFPQGIYQMPLATTMDQPTKILQNLTPISVFKKKSPLIQEKNLGYQIKGISKDRYDLIMTYPQKTFTNEMLKDHNFYFVAIGEQIDGGFTLGFIQDKHWIRNSLVYITESQKFQIYLKVTAPGTYAPTFGNNLSQDRKTYFIVEKAGWVALPHT